MRKPEIPAKPKNWPSQKKNLKELDPVDVEYGEEFYSRLHDKIMARIEKTPVSGPKPARRKASSKSVSLISLNL